jgi:hypothetical protein
MQYLLKVADSASEHMVLLTLEEKIANNQAIDVVFEIIGAIDVNQLVEENVLGAGQIDDLLAIQNIVFDKDEEGFFVREGVQFEANHEPLDPEANLKAFFEPADRNGIKYMHCDLIITAPSLSPNAKKNQSNTIDAKPVAQPVLGKDESMKLYGRIMLLHQLAIGYQLDVTKDFAELADLLPELERKELVDIDVKKASYKLTPAGKIEYDRYIAEAHDLIKRYDIFSDTDVDASGVARFDTGLGRDLRVAVFDYEGVDPFRARFLLGINDGEWNNLSNWYECIADENWFANLFKPVENAPDVDEIGRDVLRSIIDQGKTALRSEQYRLN